MLQILHINQVSHVVGQQENLDIFYQCAYTSLFYYWYKQFIYLLFLCMVA